MENGWVRHDLTGTTAGVAREREMRAATEPRKQEELLWFFGRPRHRPLGL